MNDKLLQANNGDQKSPKICPIKKHKCKFIGLVFLILFLSLFLIAGKCFWNIVKAEKVTLDTLQKRVTAIEDASALQQKNLTELHNLTKASKSRWIYAETGYLIQNAIYQVKLNHVEEANSLLNDAFEAISGISDAGPSINAIKEEMTQSISALKAVKKVNVLEIVTQINQLKQKVDSLPLSFPIKVESPKTTVKTQNEEIKSALKESWQEIKQLIVIRYHEKPVEPLVSPEQVVYLKQNLQLQLEQANLAVLYHDATLYRLSLKKALAWVNQFFDPRAKITQDFLVQLDRLSKIDVTLVSPNIVGKLNQMLNQLDPLIHTAFEKPIARANMCSIKPLGGKPENSGEVS